MHDQKNHFFYLIVLQSAPRNDIVRKCNKVLAYAPSSVTSCHLLPEGEGLGGCAIVYAKGVYKVPFRGIATARQIQSLLAMTYWYNHYKQLFPLRPPKLVHLKSASKLQTVRQLHQGWRGVANKGTSPRACGWEEYLPLNYNRRSGARHQPLPYWQFLGRTPYTH